MHAKSIPDPWAEPVSCNSWVVVCRATGQAVMETYQHSVAEKVNQTKYEVLTAYAWLVRISRRKIDAEL